MEDKQVSSSIETKTSFIASASGAEAGMLRSADSAGNGSVQTCDSSWSILKSTTLLSLNPWDWYLSFRMERIITVEPALFLYMFGNFLFTTLTQQYYINRYALEILNITSQQDNGSNCINISAQDIITGENDTQTIVESHATLLAVYCSLPYRLFSLISTLFFGPLSDYFGRRPVMIIALFGAALQGACAVCVVHFNLNMYFFVLAYALAGITGGLSSIVMAGFSYVSDVSTKRWRTVRIGIAESMVFSAGVLSAGFGGWWFKHLQCRLQDPLLLIIACHIAAILYVLIFIPQSMTKDQRKIRNRSKKSDGSLVVQGFKILFGMVEKYRPVTWVMWVTLIPMIVVVMNLVGSAAVQIFFLKYLEWGPELIGAQVALSLGSRFASLVVVLPILVALKTPDPVIAAVGAVFNLTMNLFMGLSHKTYQVFIVALLQGMDGLFFPPMRGLLSKLVATEDQGALFSLVSSSENIGMLIGEVAFPLILPISLKHNLSPGMAYVVMAGLGLVPLPFLCVLLGVWCKRRFKNGISSGKIWEHQNVNIVRGDSSEVSALLSESVRQFYDTSSAKHHS